MPGKQGHSYTGSPIRELHRWDSSFAIESGVSFSPLEAGGLVSTISGEKEYSDLHKRVSAFYSHEVTSLGFQSPIFLEKSTAPGSAELKAKPACRVSIP